MKDQTAGVPARALHVLPPSRWLLTTALSLAVAGPACADAVTDWNLQANMVITGAGAPPQQFRVFAMVQIAVHEDDRQELAQEGLPPLTSWVPAGC